MFAIAEFDDTQERRKDFRHCCPKIFVTDIRAYASTSRTKLLKLIKGDKGGGTISSSYQNAMRGNYSFNSLFLNIN